MLALWLALLATEAHAGPCGDPPCGGTPCGHPMSGKRVLEYVAPAALAVPVPGGPIDLGAALGARLITGWTRTGRWIVTDPPRIEASRGRLSAGAPPAWVWPAGVVPSVRVSVEPLSLAYRQRWILPPGLGFFFFSIAAASFRADFEVLVRIEEPLTGRETTVRARGRGRGFFFDVAVSYQGITAGIRAARRDVVDQALGRLVREVLAVVDRAAAASPLTAVVDAVVVEGGEPLVLVGTGPGAEVAPGVVYEAIGEGAPLALEVLETADAGAVARVLEGDVADARPGRLLLQRCK